VNGMHDPGRLRRLPVRPRPISGARVESLPPAAGPSQPPAPQLPSRLPHRPATQPGPDRTPGPGIRQIRRQPATRADRQPRPTTEGRTLPTALPGRARQTPTRGQNPAVRGHPGRPPTRSTKQLHQDTTRDHGPRTNFAKTRVATAVLLKLLSPQPAAINFDQVQIDRTPGGSRTKARPTNAFTTAVHDARNGGNCRDGAT
jgi:hypothetical protein